MMFEDLCVHSLAGPNLFAPRLLFIPPKRLVNPGCTGRLQPILHMPDLRNGPSGSPQHLCSTFVTTKKYLGLSENMVYSQWNSHLIGIMISKTIGFRGTNHFQKWPKMSLTAAIHHDARLVSFGGEEGPVKAGVGRGSNPSPCTLTWPWREATLWESWQMPIFDAKFISK